VLSLGAEERLEHPVQDLRRDSRARVFNRDRHVVVRAPGGDQHLSRASGRLDRLPRVHDRVEHDLL
jgi:hypothetical protein